MNSTRISRYFSHYKFTTQPTLISTLEKADTIGKQMGLRFVYIGNVPGHIYEDTFCPSCGELLTDRGGFTIYNNKLQDKKCPECGEEIPKIGKISKSKLSRFF